MSLTKWYLSAALGKSSTARSADLDGQMVERVGQALVLTESGEYTTSRAWEHVLKHAEHLHPSTANSLLAKAVVVDEDSLPRDRERVVAELIERAQVDACSVRSAVTKLKVEEALKVADDVHVDRLKQAWPALVKRARRSANTATWLRKKARGLAREGQWWVLHTHPEAGSTILGRSAAMRAFEEAGEALYTYWACDTFHGEVNVHTALAGVMSARTPQELEVAQSVPVKWPEVDAHNWRNEARMVAAHAQAKLGLGPAQDDIVGAAIEADVWAHPAADWLAWSHGVEVDQCTSVEEWCTQFTQVLLLGNYEEVARWRAWAVQSPWMNTIADTLSNVAGPAVLLQRFVTADDVWGREMVTGKRRKPWLGHSRVSDVLAGMRKYGRGRCALAPGDVLGAIRFGARVSLAEVGEEGRAEVEQYVLGEGVNDTTAWTALVEATKTAPRSWAQALFYRASARTALHVGTRRCISSQLDHLIHTALQDAGVDMKTFDALNLTTGSLAEQIETAGALVN